MIYFFKKGCTKCIWLKEQVNLKELNVTELDVETIEGRGELAWHELVGVSETTLPILVKDDGSYITSVVAIKKYLLRIKK